MVSGALFGATIGLGIQLFSNSVRFVVQTAGLGLLEAHCSSTQRQTVAAAEGPSDERSLGACHPCRARGLGRECPHRI